jgi:hypothetical protein
MLRMRRAYWLWQRNRTDSLEYRLIAKSFGITPRDLNRKCWYNGAVFVEVNGGRVVKRRAA